MSTSREGVFSKPRSRSLHAGEQIADYAIIMLHSSSIHISIARRHCLSLGYVPIIIDMPTECDKGDATVSIDRLSRRIIEEEEKLNLTGVRMAIKHVLVEANYSQPASPIPNKRLLIFIKNKFTDADLFAISGTEQCLQAIRDNEELAGIIPTTKCTTRTEKLANDQSPTQRKFSL